MIISDIHIYGPEDPLYRDLLEGIRREVGAGDALVLAGDVFDFLVGYQKRMNARYAELFELLRTLRQNGSQIAFIEGNHDFHLKRTFAEVPGMHVYPAEMELQVGDKRLYVAHGDLVDREDRGYLFLRAFFRSFFIRFVAFILPERIVEWIGNRSSQASRYANPRDPMAQSPRKVERLRSVFRAFAEGKLREGFDAVVLGHCHDLDGADFDLGGGRRGHYMNVGFPRAHRSYVVFTESGELLRKNL